MAEAIYQQHGLYDLLLPVYEFGGHTDDELLAAELAALPRPRPRRALEIGCGTGRMTPTITAHADEVTCLDSNPAMLDSTRARHPNVHAVHADARSFVTAARAQRPRPTFDLIAACWCLNYPLLACLETNTGTEITPKPLQQGTQDATAFLTALTDLLTPSGQLLVLFFDPASDEQRFVTRLWETIAPFPGTGRDFTLRLLLDHLAQTPGTVTTTHHRGHMRAPDPGHAHQWFMQGHFKGFPALTAAVDIHRAVTAFLTGYQHDDGTVAVPAGMHTIRFTRHPLPAGGG
ncbi:class I SAM-dependent methyltransferase [Streptomonospora litoralis]|uniref:Trans-aconitate 2-methyltransferase n=1 Tax=Streptomonospora litoralis TaxID=2498135 RepID=A0A4V0ZK90_9ACTN|nr:class I SAM-dependent methyltransferase [Streptomonospora litoralis]QBI56152.1 trans-aconitate 2-methyltransferase [Streptomonospora litoralis]